MDNFSTLKCGDSLVKDVQVLIEYVEYVFDLLEKTLLDITEEDLDWQPTKDANTIRWILTHLSRICNVSLPSRIKGNPSYKPKDWLNNYEETRHSLGKILMDIENGRKVVLEGLGGLSTSDLEVNIPLWGGMRKRKIGLFSHLSEIAHHKGQIAYVKGIMKRQREKTEIIQPT
jgi:hypothetical protein